MNLTAFRSMALFVVSLFAVGANLAGEPLRVDFNPNDDRSDVRSRHAVNWRILPGAAVSQEFSGVTVTIRSADTAKVGLTWGWWKGGFDTGATFASDGVTTDGASSSGIEVVLEGLSRGVHSLTTWHNAWDGIGAGRFNVLLNGESVHAGVAPSHRVAHDDDARTCHVRITADGTRPVVLRYVPEVPGNRVILNGLELDGTDPALQARRPVPALDEEHADTSPRLSWQPAAGSEGHRVWLSTVRSDIEVVQPDSRFLVGDRPGIAVGNLDPFQEYFWRVDSIDRSRSDAVTRGRIWRFRVCRLAFPGAEGYGRFAAGGRGGRVIAVTNLNDSGPGSLREAVDAVGPRTVVFRTGGTITLKSRLVVRNPYVTIAGQTAPGDGICVRGYTFGCLGTHDVIIRHLRIRVGDEARQTMDGTGFASCDHCILDHCSVSWSIDEAVSSRGAGNITVQRCLIAEALNIANHRNYQPGKGHSYAGSISGSIGSFHHNLLAHCAGRNWSLAGGLNRGGQFAGRLDIRNNVVFNWLDRTTDGGAKAVNFVANLYIPGPATRRFHLLKPDAGSAADPQRYYVQGNRMERHPAYDSHDWHESAVNVAADVRSRIRLAQPFCEPYVTTHSVEDLEANVLSNVGANHPGLDSLDRRIISDVRGRTASTVGGRSSLPGIIDSQTDSGGWPRLESGTSPVDSDGDGIPDDWERAHGLHPDDPSDARQTNSDGYSNLEQWMNSLTSRTTRAAGSMEIRRLHC